MATNQFNSLTKKGNHEVGNLNSIHVKTVAYGAIIVDAPVDNFTMVELGFNEDGERTAKKLSSHTKKGYLIATPEERFLGEAMVDFYNEVGDRGRIVILEPGYTRFDTSAFSGTIKEGSFAHWDAATSKFKIQASAEDLEFAAAENQFLVVSNEDDIDYTLGKPTVRLEVIK